jgi:hypothetical protein
MPETFEQYHDTIATLESVLSHHPGIMRELSEPEQEALWAYYFSGRELEGGALAEHWSGLVQDWPDLPAQARHALASFQMLVTAELVCSS